jgi:hypothetical protein
MAKNWGFLPDNHKLTHHPLRKMHKFKIKSKHPTHAPGLFLSFFFFFSLTSRTHLVFFFFFFFFFFSLTSPATTDSAVTHHFWQHSSFSAKPNQKTLKNSNPTSKIDFNATKFVSKASKLKPRVEG